MSKYRNKLVPSILAIERGGKTVTNGCQGHIARFYVGASDAKSALKLLKQQFGSARRFYIPHTNHSGIHRNSRVSAPNQGTPLLTRGLVIKASEKTLEPLTDDKQYRAQAWHQFNDKYQQLPITQQLTIANNLYWYQLSQ